MFLKVIFINQNRLIIDWSAIGTNFCHFIGFIFWFPTFIKCLKAPNRDFYIIQQMPNRLKCDRNESF